MVVIKGMVDYLVFDNLEKENAIREEYITNKEFRNIVIEGNYSYTEIFNSCFLSCIFKEAIFQGLDIDTCLFRNCNLSNLELMDHSYQHICFENCNLVGLNFIDSYLEDVTFTDCNLTYSNFSKTNLKNVSFVNCNLKEASFNEVKWKNLLFSNSELIDTEFLYTKLGKLDFSTCLMKNIKVDLSNLRGLCVSYEQAIELAFLLGIKIK